MNVPLDVTIAGFAGDAIEVPVLRAGPQDFLCPVRCAMALGKA